jgi:3-oxoacyl-[acyl-carrier protein] reductase
MLPKLANKVALVTGSTRGIGLVTANYLAKAGANICLNGPLEPKEMESIRL